VTTNRRHPVKVLIADDSAVFLAAASAWVAADPALRLVGTARDGEEAIAAAARFSPDLVLMDAFMPRVDGFEATQAIKSWPGAPFVVILSLTDGAEMEREARRAGADGFLAKFDFAARLTGLTRSFFGLAEEAGGAGAAPSPPGTKRAERP
jgi:DNA-binding NarL/FixJ family response regulator